MKTLKAKNLICILLAVVTLLCAFPISTVFATTEKEYDYDDYWHIYVRNDVSNINRCDNTAITRKNIGSYFALYLVPKRIKELKIQCTWDDYAVISSMPDSNPSFYHITNNVLYTEKNSNNYTIKYYNIEEYDFSAAESNVRYFYLPDYWLCNHSDFIGISWESGTFANIDFPLVESDCPGLYFSYIPADVTECEIFNFHSSNSIYDPCDYSVSNINLTTYSPGENELYPDGLNTLNNTVYIMDLENPFGKEGKWYYYYGNSEYGTSELKENAGSVLSLTDTKYAPDEYTDLFMYIRKNGKIKVDDFIEIDAIGSIQITCYDATATTRFYIRHNTFDFDFNQEIRGKGIPCSDFYKNTNSLPYDSTKKPEYSDEWIDFYISDVCSTLRRYLQYMDEYFAENNIPASTKGLGFINADNETDIPSVDISDKYILNISPNDEGCYPVTEDMRLVVFENSMNWENVFVNLFLNENKILQSEELTSTYTNEKGIKEYALLVSNEIDTIRFGKDKESTYYDTISMHARTNGYNEDYLYSEEVGEDGNVWGVIYEPDSKAIAVRYYEDIGAMGYTPNIYYKDWTPPTPSNSVRPANLNDAKNIQVTIPSNCVYDIGLTKYSVFSLSINGRALTENDYIWLSYFDVEPGEHTAKIEVFYDDDFKESYYQENGEYPPRNIINVKYYILKRELPKIYAVYPSCNSAEVYLPAEVDIPGCKEGRDFIVNYHDGHAHAYGIGNYIGYRAEEYQTNWYTTFDSETVSMNDLIKHDYCLVYSGTTITNVGELQFGSIIYDENTYTPNNGLHKMIHRGYSGGEPTWGFDPDTGAFVETITPGVMSYDEFYLLVVEKPVDNGEDKFYAKDPIWLHLGSVYLEIGNENGETVSADRATWSVSDPDNFYINKGTLTAKKPGTAKVTAEIDGQTVTWEIEFKAVDLKDTYITFNKYYDGFEATVYYNGLRVPQSYYVPLDYSPKNIITYKFVSDTWLIGEITYELFASTGLVNRIYTEEYIVGDVNIDSKLNIRDATLIQKYLAKIEELDEVQLLLADFDTNGKVNVKDASAIQKKLAGII